MSEKVFLKYEGPLVINRDNKEFYGMITKDSFLNGTIGGSNITEDDYVYFGLTDNINFNNNLESILDFGNGQYLYDYKITSDADSSCYAYGNGSKDSNKCTGLTIYLNVSETTKDRFITFKYKDTPLFYVQQIVSSISYTYNVFLKSNSTSSFFYISVSNKTELDADYINSYTNFYNKYSYLWTVNSKYPFCKIKVIYDKNLQLNAIYFIGYIIVDDDKLIMLDDTTNYLTTYGKSINMFRYVSYPDRNFRKFNHEGTYDIPLAYNNDDQYINI